MNQEPSVDFQYPEDELEAEQNLYREAARRQIRVMNIAFAFIQKKKENRCAAFWGVCYGLGLAICEGVSITEKAKHLKISPQALSKYVKQFQNEANINTSNYTYGNNKGNR